MKLLCEGYIRHAKLIGPFYCWLPTAFWFGAIFFTIPFREVYLLRLAIAVIAGGFIAARVSRLFFWLRLKAGRSSMLARSGQREPGGH